VVYFTQLMAIALGLPKEDWGLDEHHADPRSVLGQWTAE
jgi:heterodisulfide reductase subunit B